MGRELQYRIFGENGQMWRELDGERALEILRTLVSEEDHEGIGYYDLRVKPVETPAQPVLQYEDDGNVMWA